MLSGEPEICDVSQKCLGPVGYATQPYNDLKYLTDDDLNTLADNALAVLNTYLINHVREEQYNRISNKEHICSPVQA